jgi:translocator protein
MEDIVDRSIATSTGLAVATAAGVGSIASPRRVPDWYSRLRKPSYQPPGAVFPVVWTALYGGIASASARSIERFRETGQRDQANRYAVALGINLAANAGWSWLFFRYHKLGAATLGAAALAASSADLVRRAAQADARAAATLSPYPVWCAFATVLSAHIWRLNR